QRATFEDLYADAQPVDDVAELGRPFVDSCADKDEELQRQCVGIRSFLRKHYAATRMTATVQDGIQVGPYQKGSRGFPVGVRGCVKWGAGGVQAGSGRVWVGACGNLELTRHQVSTLFVDAIKWEQRVAPPLRAQLSVGLVSEGGGRRGTAAPAGKGVLGL